MKIKGMFRDLTIFETGLLWFLLAVTFIGSMAALAISWTGKEYHA